MITYKFKNDEHFSSIKQSFSYPSSFIDKQFRKFLVKYIPSSSPFLSMPHDEQQLKRMHQNILGQPTRQQSQVTVSETTPYLDSNQTEEESNPKINISKNTKNNDIKFDTKIIVHYSYEKSFHPFKRDIHRIYDDTFQKQIDKDIKLIVDNRNRRDTKKELIRKRPKQSLLTAKTPKKRNKTVKTKPIIANVADQSWHRHYQLIT